MSAPARVAATGAQALLSRIRIIRAHRGEDAAKWARTLADPQWLGESSLLKEDGTNTVRRATLLGRETVVKCREVSGAWARVKCALGRGKGDRHWRGAAMLAGKGVKTARVFVLVRARMGGRDRELLIMQWLAGPTLLRVMANVHAGAAGAPGIRAQHALARAVGRQIAQMGELLNRDHKPSNLIITGAAEVAIIDCEGIRRATIPGAARMFASLLIEPTGCGVRPRRALMMRTALAWLETETPDGVEREDKRAMLRTIFADVARVIAHHGDPTPRINPLAGT